ncbi:MAG: ankyrin repeat domain-containing protein [Scytonema sp. PMC 1070.18]|nr:ankyrin repeat domain-containing protein [Scytonema sp. PMC 1070.18]
MSIKTNGLGDRGELESTPKSLYSIIKEKNIAKIQEIIQSGVDINRIDEESGWTPLEIAVNEGDIEIINTLLEAGALVQEGSSTPLHLAACNGSTEVVNLVLEAGKYVVREKDSQFYDALLTAICGGYVEIVRSLIGVGADVNHLWDCGSGLHYAVQNNYKAIVEVLLTAGADVDIRDPDEYGYQFTPLMEAACEVGSEIGDIVQILIAFGADVHGRDIHGRTPLILAAEFDNVEAVSKLIQAGADVNAKDNDGKTALVYASRHELLGIESSPDTLMGYFNNTYTSERVSVAKILLDAGGTEIGV